MPAAAATLDFSNERIFAQVLVFCLLDSLQPHSRQDTFLDHFPRWLTALAEHMEHRLMEQKETEDGLKFLLQTAMLLVQALQDLRRSSVSQQWSDGAVQAIVPDLLDLESTLLPAK